MNSNVWEKKDHFSSHGLKICHENYFHFSLRSCTITENLRQMQIKSNTVYLWCISVFYDFSEVICGSVRFSSKQSRWHILEALIFRIHFLTAQKGAAPTELWRDKGLSTNKFLQKIVSEEYILFVSIFLRFRLG